MAAKSVVIKDFSKEIPGTLSDPFTWKFPPIMTKKASGASLSWTILVRVADTTKDTYGVNDFLPIQQSWFENRPMDYVAICYVESGQLDAMGVVKVRESSPTVISVGKNVGKINATNVFCQALRDCLGKYTKQARKAVTTDDVYLPPMLAQVATDQKSLVIDESHVGFMQPKLDGVRSVATLAPRTIEEPTWTMYSRRKIAYPGFNYIRQELNDKVTAQILTVDTTYGEQTITHLDGEVYSHGVSLQIISSISRRDAKQGDPILSFHIYDCILEDRKAIYEVRLAALTALMAKLPTMTHLVMVPTERITELATATIAYQKWLAESYEGAMLRLNHPYEMSYNEHHSKSLLKYKPTYDHEYPIAGYFLAGKGKASGALMMICAVNDKSFNVTPAIEIAERKALGKKMAIVEANGKSHFDNHWLHKPLVVLYDELSTDGIPQRARTKLVIRTWD